VSLTIAQDGVDRGVAAGRLDFGGDGFEFRLRKRSNLLEAGGLHAVWEKVGSIRL
jgi:hypothetical protein